MTKKKQSTESAVREIRRRTRRKFSPEEKIRIVLEGLRGEQSVPSHLESTRAAATQRHRVEVSEGEACSGLPVHTRA